MKCPACDFDLTEMEMGGVKVDACNGGCGGIWFDAFELQRVDEQSEVPSHHLLRVQHDARRPVDAARKRACPRCDGVKLKRHFFSARKAVEVDQCPNCNGYWLDAGELEKVRAEIAAKATQATVQVTTVSMETIRYVYKMRVEQRAS